MAEHLKRGTIRESWSPYAANFFFVKKKDGKLRPVQDYCLVNKWTKRNCNVSPLIPQTIDRLSGCTLFTKFDIRWGYNNIRIKPGDEPKAAFLTPEGLFEPTVMFFGLTNSPATFQMMMNTIFHKQVAQGWLSVYMDNLAIHTRRRPGETEEEHRRRHEEYVYIVLDILEENDLYLKPEKCAFEQNEIDYLGVIVGQGTLKMDPKKIQNVADWSPPTTVTEVRQFLGFTGYYIKISSRVQGGSIWPVDGPMYGTVTIPLLIERGTPPSKAGQLPLLVNRDFRDPEVARRKWQLELIASAKV